MKISSYQKLKSELAKANRKNADLVEDIRQIVVKENVQKITTWKMLFRAHQSAEDMLWYGATVIEK